tara:strand:- start:283 stop:438 length:156 start_codon:yes stop_codon:yes gene_type:complete
MRHKHLLDVKCFVCKNGEMAEWSIALPWKGSNWATGSGVRIPVSPPLNDVS